MEIALEGWSGELRVDLLPGVVIKTITREMVCALVVLYNVCQKQGVIPIMTGASQNKAYPKGGLHDRGLAWDFRSGHLPNPTGAFLEIVASLKSLDKGYRALYHDSGYGMHFHVEYNVSAKRKP